MLLYKKLLRMTFGTSLVKSLFKEYGEKMETNQLSQHSDLCWASEKPVMFVRVPKKKGISCSVERLSYSERAY